jgi:hypothetical protein
MSLSCIDSHYPDTLLTTHRSRLLRLRVRHHTSDRSDRPHTNGPSPVIVAERMIGCAMYELVCDTLNLPRHLLTALGPRWSR